MIMAMRNRAVRSPSGFGGRLLSVHSVPERSTVMKARETPKQNLRVGRRALGTVGEHRVTVFALRNLRFLFNPNGVV